jgi:hypothetical protein
MHLGRAPYAFGAHLNAFGDGMHLECNIYAAESMNALKLGWCVGCIGPWALNLTGVYIGIMAVYVLAGQDVVPTNAFGDTINAFMDQSMAGYIIGSIVFVAGMAAILGFDSNCNLSANHD